MEYSKYRISKAPEKKFKNFQALQLTRLGGNKICNKYILDLCKCLFKWQDIKLIMGKIKYNSSKQHSSKYFICSFDE